MDLSFATDLFHFRHSANKKKLIFRSSASLGTSYRFQCPHHSADDELHSFYNFFFPPFPVNGVFANGSDVVRKSKDRENVEISVLFRSGNLRVSFFIHETRDVSSFT